MTTSYRFKVTLQRGSNMELVDGYPEWREHDDIEDVGDWYIDDLYNNDMTFKELWHTILKKSGELYLGKLNLSKRGADEI